MKQTDDRRRGPAVMGPYIGEVEKQTFVRRRTIDADRDWQTHSGLFVPSSLYNSRRRRHRHLLCTL